MTICWIRKKINLLNLVEWFPSLVNSLYGVAGESRLWLNYIFLKWYYDQIFTPWFFECMT